jgi:hypothetical protein
MWQHLYQGKRLGDPLAITPRLLSRGQTGEQLPAAFDESLKRFCLSFSCISHPLWSLSATTQVPHDIAASIQPKRAIQALSTQRQNGTETGGRYPNHPIDELNCDGSQSRFRLDGEFLGSVALFTVDRTLSHPPHLFNGIEVSAVGRPLAIGAGDCDADCIECFFRLLCSMK